MTNTGRSDQGLVPSTASLRKGGEDASVVLQELHQDDFLPSPGPWTRALGRQLALALTLGAGALAVWPMQETVRAQGTVRPVGENTLLQSELGGRVQQVMLRPNQHVRQGQVLAILDSRTLEAEHDQVKQELTALQRQANQSQEEQRSLQAQVQALGELSNSWRTASRRGVDQAKASLEFEQNQLKRYQSLLASGAVPKSIVEEKQARQLVSRSELFKALQGVSEQEARGASELARLKQTASQSRASADEWSKQLAQRRARLLQINRAIDQATVRAPISGSVIQTSLRHPGQIVQPAETMAVLAPASERLMIKLLVPPDLISQVRTGQKASLRVASCPTAEFGVLTARVLSVGADTQTQRAAEGGAATSAYEVLVQPKRNSLKGRKDSCQLRLGMQITGDIITRQTTVLGFLLNKLRIQG